MQGRLSLGSQGSSEHVCQPLVVFPWQSHPCPCPVGCRPFLRKIESSRCFQMSPWFSSAQDNAAGQGPAGGVGEDPMASPLTFLSAISDPTHKWHMLVLPTQCQFPWDLLPCLLPDFGEIRPPAGTQEGGAEPQVLSISLCPLAR